MLITARTHWKLSHSHTHAHALTHWRRHCHAIHIPALFSIGFLRPAVITSTKPHSLHENWLYPLSVRKNTHCRPAIDLTRCTAFKGSPLHYIYRPNKVLLFILRVGTIQLALWFKGLDGWLKGLEMRMEMRRAIQGVKIWWEAALWRCLLGACVQKISARLSYNWRGKIWLEFLL